MIKLYKKYLKNIATVSLCLLFVFVYYQTSNKQEKTTTQTKTPTNYQTVVFKDDSDTLIPVSINLKCQDDPETNYREMIEAMKSTDYQYLGLYPILDEKLELNSLVVSSNDITFDFSNHLKVSNNQEALDIFEALSYVFCHDTIEKVNLKIDGKAISTLENSTIPTSCVTNRLGINNFQSSTADLYKTTSVVVYNTKTIEGEEYFVPISTRIETNESDLSSEVSLLLDNFEYPKKITTSQQCSLIDGVLSVYLSSNILEDSETIDSTLYQRLVKSLQSIDDVQTVQIYVDDQLIEDTTNVNSLIDNRIKL